MKRQIKRRELIQGLGATALGFYLSPMNFSVEPPFKAEAATIRKFQSADDRGDALRAMHQANMSPDEIWAKVRAELTASASGKRLLSAIDGSCDELRTLTMNHKRVGTVWQRLGGLDWAEQIFNCLRDNRRLIPHEWEGRTLENCVRQFASVLLKYGSSELARDSAVLSRGLMALPGRSYDQVLALWRSQAAYFS